MKLSNTTIRELSAKYRAILKKCAILNTALFTVMISSQAMALTSGISYGTKDGAVYRFFNETSEPGLSKLTQNFDGEIGNTSLPVGNVVYGGYSNSSETSENYVHNNTITITATDLSSTFIPNTLLSVSPKFAQLSVGYSTSGTVSQNELIIENPLTLLTDITADPYAFIGGETNSGIAKENIVDIKNTITTGNAVKIYGGVSTSGEVSNNTVIFEENAGGVNHAYGGYSYGAGNVFENTINIKAGVVGHVYAGYSEDGNVSANTVNLTGGVVRVIFAGRSVNGNVFNNTINLTGGKSGDTIYGGYSTNAKVYGNKIYINNLSTSDTESSITGGETKSGEAYNNEVYVENLTLNDLTGLIAGATKNGTAHDNTLYLNGKITGNDPSYSYLLLYPTLLSGSGTAYDNRLIFGKNFSMENAYLYEVVGSGSDILEVWTKNLATTYGELKGFNRYYFVLPSTIENGDTVISIANTAVDIDGAQVGVATQSGVNLDKGDKVTLIDKTTGTPTQVEITADKLKAVEIDGSSFTTDYTFGLSLEETATVGENSLVATVKEKKTNDEIKAPAEGQATTVALLNASADLIASGGLENAVNATQAAFGNMASFGVISGGYSKYKTGSHVNLTSVSLLTGFSKKFGNNTTAGVFVEAGYGDYSTHNEFTRGNVKGTGDSKYYGLGLMGHYDITKNIYTEASVHGGYLNNDWKSKETSVPVSYDTDSLYYGAHFGLGYETALNKVLGLRIYGKYFYTHQEGDDTTIDGAKFDFKDIDSHITRLGTRLNYAVLDNVKPFIGVAWDHEFDGKAESYAADVKTDSPSLKGDTGMMELGLKADELCNWEMDASLQGFIGQREGIQGLIKAKYNF